MVTIHVAKRKPPELQLRGFSIPFYYVGRLRPFRLCCLFVSAQPFADVVANYTRHNRDKKCDDMLHVFTSFLLERVGSTAIIARYKKPVPLFVIFLQSWKRFTQAQPLEKASIRIRRGDVALQ